MMNNNIRVRRLTDHVAYRIIDSTIYLFQEENISDEEMEIVYKKLFLLIEDNDIAYINISTRNMEEKKEFYNALGFSLSYYDVNKLNILYDGKKNKKDYRCYGIMTKRDFLDKLKDNKKDSVIDNREVKKANSGFVNGMLLLFGGIILLCYFCVQGAIYLVK